VQRKRRENAEKWLHSLLFFLCESPRLCALASVVGNIQTASKTCCKGAYRPVRERTVRRFAINYIIPPPPVCQAPFSRGLLHDWGRITCAYRPNPL
jgi:hypothetical protein